FLACPLSAADQENAKVTGPNQGQYQRCEQRNAHGDGQCAEESSRNSSDRNQRQEYNDWSERRSYEWNGKFLEGAVGGFERTFAAVTMQNDILDDNDFVI